MASVQLIPGLPTDLAIQCLLCLPSTELRRAEKVNSLWKIAISSDRFYVQRRRRAFFPSVYVIHRINSGYEILDCDSEQITKPRLLFSCDLQAGQKLFPAGVVFASVGISIFAFAPGRQVQKFSLLTRKWTLVNKTMPSACKLFVATVDKHVVVLACKRYDGGDDDDDGNPDGQCHDVDDGVSMCEVFNSEDNQWAPLDGLPDAFMGTHCITCQGVVYARGRDNTVSVSVYALNLSKKRWEEDVRMIDRMQNVLHDSKVIAHSDTMVMASQQDTIGPVCLQFQRAGSLEWRDVLVNVVSPGDFFVLEQGSEVVLAVLDVGQSWWSQEVFFYNGMKILHIPSDKLVMVGPISG